MIRTPSTRPASNLEEDAVLLKLLLAAFAAVIVPNEVLAPIDTHDFSSSWSPDGRRLAFVSRRDGNNEIYVMNADGSDLKRLTNAVSRESGPAWSPDGKHISFRSDRDGSVDLYVMDADGSNLRRLTNIGAVNDRHSWSPATEEIVFAAEKDGQSQLYVIRPDGTGLRQLLRSDANDAYPVWSPDGARIAFDSDRDGQDEIYVIDRDGTHLRRVTRNPTMDSYPGWSPDGRRLVFISFRAHDSEIYTIGVDGRNERQLTNSLDWDLDPLFSPDGKWITFNSRRDGRRAIYVMRTDGTKLRKLTNTDTSDYVARLRRSGGPSETPPGGEKPPYIAGELRALALQRLAERRLTEARRLAEAEVAAFPGYLSYSALARVRRAQNVDSPPTMPEFLRIAASDCNRATAINARTQRMHPGWVQFAPQTLNLVVRGQLSQGHAAHALCLARLNVAANPKSSDARLWLGNALLRSGDRAAARAQYREALGLSPSDTAIARALRQIGQG
ncbi:MAG: hypothetical protein ABIQ43_08640 [Sphingomonas sp.]